MHTGNIDIKNSDNNGDYTVNNCCKDFSLVTKFLNMSPKLEKFGIVKGFIDKLKKAGR